MDTHRNRELMTNDRHHVPLPSGPYKTIGVRDIMIGFSKRTGFMVRLYYPAEDQSRDIRSQYLWWPNWLPHENYREGYLAVGGIKSSLLQKALKWYSGECFIPAIVKAKPLRTSQKMPPIVFSHGGGGCRSTYSSLCLEFASHGYIVAAVEHRDGTACCTFYAKETRMPLSTSTMNITTTDGPLKYEDDEEEGFDEIDDPNYIPPKALSNSAILPHIATEWICYLPIKGGRYELRNRQVHRRVKECIRTLDLLEALEAGYEVQNLLDPLLDPSEFEGLIDIEKAVIMGHSYGGATALMSLSAELRFKLAICLDAWMYPIHKENFDLVTQPVLFINSEKYHTKENLRAIKQILTLPDYCYHDLVDAKPTNNSKNSLHNAAPGEVLEEENVKPANKEEEIKMEENKKPNTSEDETDRKGLIERNVVTIKGTNHYNQTDIPFVMPWLVRALYGANSSRNPFTAHDLTAHLSLQFIRKNLTFEKPIIENQSFLEAQRKKIKYGIKDK